MNKYFEKGKRLLIKKGYVWDGYDTSICIYFKQNYNDDIALEIWFDTFCNEFLGDVHFWTNDITTQEEIDEIQLAYNNLQADLKELKEIKQ